MVRLYNDADRRIISQYEFVPVYSNMDIPESFTAMRTMRFWCFAVFENGLNRERRD